jgi:hypothetical protein
MFAVVAVIVSGTGSSPPGCAPPAPAAASTSRPVRTADLQTATGFGRLCTVQLLSVFVVYKYVIVKKA